MIEQDLVLRGIADSDVLEALATVPREEFVQPQDRERAYADRALPIPCAQTISQPFVVAHMVEALQPEAGDRALEVGAGCGYAACVLARLVERVWGIERHLTLVVRAREVVERLGVTNVHISVGDGCRGLAAEAPFDVILVSAATEAVPDALFEQLSPGGRLIAPLGDPGAQELILHRAGETGRVVERRRLGGVRFVPLVGG